MKTTLKDIWLSQRVLGKLSKVTPLPIKTSYWLGIRTKKLMKEIEEIESKRLELVRKYGVLESGTKNMSVPEDRMNEFVKEFNDLLATEVELDIQKFNISDFEGNSTISGEDMVLLSFLFNEPV
jgi:hypothetical protein